MTWVISIILILILIGIIRNYPKFSLFCAIGIFLIYINTNPKPNNNNNNNNNNVEKVNLIENKVKDNVKTNYSNGFKQHINNSNNYNTYQPRKNNYPSQKKCNYKQNRNLTIVKVRIGAICKDGTTSSATGRGACSHHGGVAYWLYK